MRVTLVFYVYIPYKSHIYVRLLFGFFLYVIWEYRRCLMVVGQNSRDLEVEVKEYARAIAREIRRNRERVERICIKQAVFVDGWHVQVITDRYVYGYMADHKNEAEMMVKALRRLLGLR